MNPVEAVVSAIGGPEVIQLREIASLEPSGSQVRVAIEAAAACYTDVLIRRRRYPAHRTPPPFVIGYDFVGRVDAVGPDATWQIGDRVCDLSVTGAAATHVMADSARLQPVPDDVDAAEAESIILSYLTAYQALVREAGVVAGSRVLVIGASGAVGRAALDIGQAAGWVVTGVASASRSDVVASLGGTPIAYDSPSYRDDLVAAAGDGFDAILDTAGTLPKRLLLRLIVPGGHLAVVGFAGALGPAGGSGSRLAALAAEVGTVVNTAVAGAVTRRRSARFYVITDLRKKQPQWYAHDLAVLFGWHADGRIHPHVQQRYPLTDVVEAHRRLEAGGIEGRICLVATS